MSIYFTLPVSFLVTLLITPIMKKVAVRYSIMDNPINALKTHKQPTPYLGGVGMFIGAVSSWILCGLRGALPSRMFLGIIGCGFAVMLLGLLDDILNIRQTYKFAIQIVISGVLVGLGCMISIIPIWYVAAPLTVFYIIGACNALNLLDGLDGLAAGVSSIVSVFFLLLFYLEHDIAGMILSLSLLGVTTGFLLFNSAPASIFMGDAGSMFLGFTISLLMIFSSDKIYDLQSFIAPILIAGVPIFDTALTYTRRYLNNRPIFPGDRSHFYDQLVDRGFSSKRTVFICYAVGGVFGAIAVAVKLLTFRFAMLLFLATAITTVAFVWKLKLLTVKS